MRTADPDDARPWIFVGTIPEASFPLVCAPFRITPGGLYFDGRQCPVNRGTPAMLAAAALAMEAVSPDGGERNVLAVVAGDTGTGKGSSSVYQSLVTLLPQLAPRGITFHYLLPDVDWHNRILMAVEELACRPILVADAGFMYAAKMSGYASRYDLFTPDIGELAFLADAKAPHPFYTRNFLLADEERAEELIEEAYAHENAARHLLVKGKVDRYVREGRTLLTFDAPDVPMLEPVGGTGDTLTGIVSALLAAGVAMPKACAAAFTANRLMGEMANPTPAFSVAEILPFLKPALTAALEAAKEVPEHNI